MACSKCAGDDALTHSDWEHSEDWVNLADARYTGEVLWMDTFILDQALKVAIPENVPTELRTKGHVDRRIIQALIDTIQDCDPYGDPDATWALEQLQKLLNENPVRELE
jgi:hypothetical protein